MTEINEQATSAIESSTLFDAIREMNRHIEKLEGIGGTGVVHSVCEALRHRKVLIDKLSSNSSIS